MSEFQYYDFLAVDRPLTAAEQRSLRRLSSRAEITSNRFTNNYSYGDFRGDPAKLVPRYFDAFLYMANWGTYELMLRLPLGTLKLDAARAYCGGESTTLNVRRHGSHLVLHWRVQEEDGGGWLEEDPALLEALVPLRTELMEGDLRPLYLGWLSLVDHLELKKDAAEPPVPAGLGSLTRAQKALAQFLVIDPKLVRAAARLSPVRTESAKPAAAFESWLRALPRTKQADWLVRLAQEPNARTELANAFRRAHPPKPTKSVSPRRTVAELLRAARGRNWNEDEDEAASDLLSM